MRVIFLPLLNLVLCILNIDGKSLNIFAVLNYQNRICGDTNLVIFNWQMRPPTRDLKTIIWVLDVAWLDAAEEESRFDFTSTEMRMQVRNFWWQDDRDNCPSTKSNLG